MIQQILAWLIIGACLIFSLRKPMRLLVLDPLAQLLLKRGQIKWAMRIRPKTSSGCDDCH